MAKDMVDSRLTKRYFDILRELNELGLSRFPEEVLPAPKQTIEQALTAQMEGSGKERLDVVISTLDLFEEKSAVASDFIGKLITAPSVITLIYTIWLGFQGESWLWTMNIVLIPLTVGGTFVWKFLRYSVVRPKSLLKAVLYSLPYVSLETFALGSTGVIAIKLEFLSGWWGLIQSIAKMDWSGIIFALVAIFLGYYMSKYTNKIFLFLR